MLCRCASIKATYCTVPTLTPSPTRMILHLFSSPILQGTPSSWNWKVIPTSLAGWGMNQRSLDRVWWSRDWGSRAPWTLLYVIEVEYILTSEYNDHVFEIVPSMMCIKCNIWGDEACLYSWVCSTNKIVVLPPHLSAPKKRVMSSHHSLLFCALLPKITSGWYSYA